jgi:hypothetical protein
MVHSPIPSKRLLLAGGLALATLAAPAVMSMTVASSTLAACTTGEESDVFTTTCVPFLVPSSNQGFTSTAANPDIPEIDGIPCTGRDSGACIGLSEDQAAAGPQPVPRSTISSSP